MNSPFFDCDHFDAKIHYQNLNRAAGTSWNKYLSGNNCPNCESYFHLKRLWCEQFVHQMHYEELIQFNASFSPKGSLSFFKHKKGDSDSLIEVHISVAITVQVTLWKKKSSTGCTLYPTTLMGSHYRSIVHFPFPFKGVFRLLNSSVP